MGFTPEEKQSLRRGTLVRDVLKQVFQEHKMGTSHRKHDLLTVTTDDMNENEIRSLALERVVKTLVAATFDHDGPLFGGLKDDEISTIGGEINRIITGIEAESATNPTPTMVWEVVCGALPNYSWWEQFRFSEGANWETPGTLTVTGENPNGGRSITKRLSALDLLHTYLAMEQKTHCGDCDLIADPDICSSDLILQHAMFGEIVYG